MRQLFGLHECYNIVIWVVHGELDIGEQAAAEAIEGACGVAIDGMNPLREPREGLFAEAVEDFRFIVKVEIDGPRGVLDFFGDFAHGDMVVAFLDEQSAGGVENLLSNAFAMPGSS